MLPFLILFWTGVRLSSGDQPLSNFQMRDDKADAASDERCAQLSFFSFNVYGISSIYGGRFKQERLAALAEKLANFKYDVVAFEELWEYSDHAMLSKSLEKANYTVASFHSLSVKGCNGRLTPLYCSGLAMASKIDFADSDVSFDAFSEFGDQKRAFTDGEALARKGVGTIRLTHDESGLLVDVIVAHTLSDYVDYDYISARETQIREIQDHVHKSDADLVVLMVDLNATPDGKTSEGYRLLARRMVNAAEAAFPDQWKSPSFATYKRRSNSFTEDGDDAAGTPFSAPVLLDYIFYLARDAGVTVEVTDFASPRLETVLRREGDGGEDGKRLSLSDHEPIAAELRICKKY